MEPACSRATCCLSEGSTDAVGWERTECRPLSFRNVRLWEAEMPAFATGMGAKQPGGGKWPTAE
jgi:hypothetical protein